jgi:hypothetical protein
VQDEPGRPRDGSRRVGGVPGRDRRDGPRQDRHADDEGARRDARRPGKHFARRLVSQAFRRHRCFQLADRMITGIARRTDVPQEREDADGTDHQGALTTPRQPPPFHQQAFAFRRHRCLQRLRPQAHVRQGSPTARVTPQHNERFESVVISLCRFVDWPTMQAAGLRQRPDPYRPSASQPSRPSRSSGTRPAAPQVRPIRSARARSFSSSRWPTWTRSTSGRRTSWVRPTRPRPAPSSCSARRC